MPIPTSDRLLRIGLRVALALGTLLLDGLAVAYVWAAGVSFATRDRVEPGESGFQINPMPAGYKAALGVILAINIGSLFYLLLKRRHGLALSFAAGAAVPMSYLVLLLISA